MVTKNVTFKNISKRRNVLTTITYFEEKKKDKFLWRCNNWLWNISQKGNNKTFAYTIFISLKVFWIRTNRVNVSDKNSSNMNEA